MSVLAEPPTTETPNTVRSRAPKWWKRREFLWISIGIHLLFGVGAGYLVVSHYSATRKLTFNAGPKSPNASERALQHRVQVQEKMKNPPAAIPKRVLSAGASKISLPPLPDITGPKNATPPPLMAAAGQNAKFGAAPGAMGAIGGTGGGAPINFFGMREKTNSIVLMIDVSDSMFTRTGDAEGRNLVKHGKEQNFQTVRDEAIKLVESLGPDIQFGIVRWSGGARTWKPELVPATDENKKAAIEHIQNQVDMKTAKPEKGQAGGTRHDLAIQAAFGLKPQVIFMLTDGNATISQPGGGLKPIPPEELFKAAADGQKGLSRSAKLNVIYYVTGQERDDERDMLQQLARRNGGSFIKIRAKGNRG
jgi:hypothetical protein